MTNTEIMARAAELSQANARCVIIRFEERNDYLLLPHITNILLKLLEQAQLEHHNNTAHRISKSQRIFYSGLGLRS